MKIRMITGCSSGIGRGIAEAALKRGGEVIVDTILKDNYPRRLLLGTDAVDRKAEHGTRNEKFSLVTKQ